MFIKPSHLFPCLKNENKRGIHLYSEILTDTTALFKNYLIQWTAFAIYKLPKEKKQSNTTLFLKANKLNTGF